MSSSLKRALRSTLILFITLWGREVSAQCVYLDRHGEIHRVNSPAEIPEEYRQNSRCAEQPEQKVSQGGLAKPQDLDLGNTVRREELSTPMGRIYLRWDRGVEQIFGRPPHRAVSDAMATVNRFLRRAGVVPHKLVPSHLTEWQVVVMDENVPSEQVPSYLVSNCHPGWMTPPTNIYLVGQRVAAGCGSSSGRSQAEADQELSRVVLHEIGHVVEYHLLAGQMGGDRARAEGFASWFEQAASEYSHLIPSGSTRTRYMTWAKAALDRGYSISQPFGGGAHDYAVASLLFFAIAERRGLDDVISVYDRFRQQGGGSFRETAAQAVHWNEATLEKEMRGIAQKYAR